MMPPKPTLEDGIAQVVAAAIKTGLGPLAARVAALEARLAGGDAPEAGTLDADEIESRLAAEIDR